jgi:hypothetical protein
VPDGAVPDRDAFAAPSFWSQVDAARSYPNVARACERLFAALGALAPQLPDASAVVAASTLSRRLGDAASGWRMLVPESVLLAEVRDAATAAGAASPDLAVDPAVVRGAAAELTQELETLLTRTSAVADAPARRLAARTLEHLHEVARVLAART